DISDKPYFLNLGPFAFYWFTLERQRTEAALSGEEVPLLRAANFEEVFSDRNRSALGGVLETYVRSRRWFSGKARTITSLQVTEVVELPDDAGQLTFLRIDYADGEPETYLLPLAILQARRAHEQDARIPTLIARLRDGYLL